MAQAVDFRVNLRLLLYVGIGVGEIRFRLVVIVVGNEIVHGILRKEFPILLCELRGKRLIVRHDERWLPDILDDMRDGVGLPRSGSTKERLVAQTLFNSLRKLLDGGRLVACRGKRLVHGKRRHSTTIALSASVI